MYYREVCNNYDELDTKLPDRTDVISQGQFTDVGPQLRVHLDNIDTYYLSNEEAERIMTGAYQSLEQYLGRPLVAHNRRLYWNRVPKQGCRIKQTPLREISRVFYVDDEHQQHDIPETNYQALGLGDFVNIGEPAIIYPKGDRSNGYGGWQIDSSHQISRQTWQFRVDVAAGWEIDSMPPPLQQAALMIATDWFQNKGSGVGVQMFRVKHDVRQIVNRYRHTYTMVV